MTRYNLVVEASLDGWRLVTCILHLREGDMKNSAGLLILALTIAWLLVGCGRGTGELPPSPMPGPEEGAREWIDAIANQDGNRILKYTCLAQRENVQELSVWVSAFSGVAKLFSLGSVTVDFEGDVSDLHFETISQTGDQAKVRVYGELRVSPAKGIADAYQVDQEWDLIRENGTWRWCGSDSDVKLALSDVPTPTPTSLPTATRRPTSTPTAQSTPTPTPNIEETPTAQVEAQKEHSQASEEWILYSVKNPEVENQWMGSMVRVNDRSPDRAPLIGFLPNEGGQDISLVVSPDRSQLAFVSDRSGKTQIYVIPMKSDDIRQITNETEEIFFISEWSPDGKQIIYSMEEGIFAVDVASGQVAKLLDGLTPVSWSPDLSKIVYADQPEGDMEIYVMDADGKNVVQLTNNEVDDMFPVWSPDGSRIAFLTEVKSQELPELYVMDADGGNLRKLAPVYLYLLALPVWSPDGSRIAYVAQGTNYPWADIYTIDVVSGEVRQVTEDPYLEAVWSWIAVQE